MSITVVSGLPRSGTSLLMQMLSAAGLPVLTDGLRTADANNRNGYFEWEQVKQLPREPRLIAAADGKVVKVISLLLSSLPRGFDYRILFLERDISEVAKSQRAMIANLGTVASAVSPEQMEHSLRAHRKQVDAWLASRPEWAVLRVSHRRLLETPERECERIAQFLGLGAEQAGQMAERPDRTLWRERSLC